MCARSPLHATWHVVMMLVKAHGGQLLLAKEVAAPGLAVLSPRGGFGCVPAGCVGIRAVNCCGGHLSVGDVHEAERLIQQASLLISPIFG